MLQKKDGMESPVAGMDGSRKARGFATSLKRHLVSEYDVVMALIVREMKTRFGRYKLGYLWAVLEPLGYIGAFSILRLAFGKEPISGMEFPLFFTMGVIPFMIFNDSVMQSLPIVESNQGLFIYRRIRPYHCVLSRLILEFIIYLASVVLILSIFAFFGYGFNLGNWVVGTLLVSVFFFFCLGLGLIMCILGPLFQESTKIAPIFMRPLFFLSGVIIPASAIPEPYFSWVEWNAMLQFVELFRVLFFEGYRAPFESMSYVLTWTLLLLGTGIFLYRKFEVKVMTSGSIKLR